MSPGRIQAPRDPSIAAAAPPTGDNPLYRRTFVGREADVKQLQAAFDAALSGQGGLVMVVGEPGIGKTALCEQLATYVALRGGKPLVGHCYEEGSLSLPYLAFVEAMRSYVLAREPDGLRSDLGTGAADVARIVSEVRDRVTGVELRPAGDPEDERWRLLQAITSFLRNASTVQPLCIVLEDLHWADRGTLDLLLHLSRNLSGARLLIIGTYRDVEVDRSHPLSATLGELRRVGTFARIPLRGLTVDEVHRMYEAIRGQATPWGQAEAVHRQTEGNPLFVQEVLRYLVEEGIVVREGGHYLAQGGEGVGIPEGLRDVVGRRLSRLSEKTNQVLAVAAVMGRDFRLDMLQRVAGLSDEEVEAALQEAQARAIIESRSALGALGFRFSHAFFRQTLYEEIFASRRLRLHQQVARALEEVYARRLEEHASELAEHFAQSTDNSDLEKALHYSVLAAQRATGVFDYGESARHLEQALKILDVLDLDDPSKRCDLLLGLSDALVPAGEWQRAVEQVAEQAYALAVALQDAHRASLACQVVQRTTLNDARFTMAHGELYRGWVERADRWAQAGTSDRVYADNFRANFARTVDGDEAQTRVYSLRALELAKKLGDVAIVARAAAGLLSGAITPPEQHAERLTLAQSIADLDFDGVAVPVRGLLLQAWSYVHLTWGNRGATEELWKHLSELEQLSHDVSLAMVPLTNIAQRQMLDGQLEGTLDTADGLRAKGISTGRATAAAANAGQVSRRALIYLGRAEEALTGIPQVTNLFAQGGIFSGQRAMCLAYAGRLDEAQEILNQFKAQRNLGSPEDPTSAAVLRYLLEPAVLCGDKELAEGLMRRFAPLANLLHTEANMTYCIGRLIGDAANLLDKPDEARGYYNQALEVCEKVRFRPEIALTRLSLAELLLSHYPDERDAAIEHLDFAIADLRDMKMQPALERALRHRGLLKA